MLAVSAVFMNGSHGVLEKSDGATRKIGQHLLKVMKQKSCRCREGPVWSSMHL